ncbi:uncharacterized protein [Branchiostoma lanceolatum]|uniref:uncharacterized protein isoform X3 n=1 Tax=Branchiostoma lanceolatum TaxID=7740 RepID=UPI00345324A7
MAPVGFLFFLSTCWTLLHRGEGQDYYSQYTNYGGGGVDSSTPSQASYPTSYGYDQTSYNNYQPQPSPSVAACGDQHNLCSEWAKNNQCVENSGYMLEMCPQSCRAPCPQRPAPSYPSYPSYPYPSSYPYPYPSSYPSYPSTGYPSYPSSAGYYVSAAEFYQLQVNVSGIWEILNITNPDLVLNITAEMKKRLESRTQTTTSTSSTTTTTTTTSGSGFGTGAAGSADCCAGVKCVPRDKLSCSLNEQVLPYGECCYQCLGETGYRYGHCDMLPNTAIPLDQQTPIAGYVDVRQKLSGGKIEVRMQVLGFDSKSRSYGITVLQFGDLSRGCLSAGDHYNPFNNTHGGAKDQVRHLGDWGNVEADSTGEVNAIIKDEVASMVGPYSIIGRTIVIHANEDDLGRGEKAESKKTGNVGKRLACCVLGHSDGTHWKDLEKRRKRKREAVRVEGPSAKRVVRSPRRN